jgi:hypothetical protein
MLLLLDQRRGFVNLFRVPGAKIDSKQVPQHRLNAAVVEFCV